MRLPRNKNLKPGDIYRIVWAGDEEHLIVFRRFEISRARPPASVRRGLPLKTKEVTRQTYRFIASSCLSDITEWSVSASNSMSNPATFEKIDVKDLPLYLHLFIKRPEFYRILQGEDPAEVVRKDLTLN
jgi:hypothetical protein